MLIFGPAAGPRISAVTWYPPSSARSLITFSPSTMSTAGSVMVEPTSPASLSTVRTSSTDALLCLPPQRTIAYTKNSLSLVPARRRIAASYERRGDRAADIARRSPAGPADRGRSQSPRPATASDHCPGQRRHANHREYQTMYRQSPAPGSGPALTAGNWPAESASLVLVSAGVARSGGPALRCADRLGLLRGVDFSASTDGMVAGSAADGSPPGASSPGRSTAPGSAAAGAATDGSAASAASLVAPSG